MCPPISRARMFSGYPSVGKGNSKGLDDETSEVLSLVGLDDHRLNESEIRVCLDMILKFKDFSCLDMVSEQGFDS